MDTKKRYTRWIPILLGFIAKSVLGNYVVSILATGVAVVAGVLVSVLAGLSLSQSALLFVGVGLIAYAVTAMLANAFIPAEWLTQKQLALTPATEPTPVRRYQAEALPPPLSSTEASARRNMERVVRADLVALSDELAAAQETIIEAYNNCAWWSHPIDTHIWNAVSDKHADVRYFHSTRSIVRDAYRRIRTAEELRNRHFLEDGGDGRIEAADREELRQVVPKVVLAEQALSDFLRELDSR